MLLWVYRKSAMQVCIRETGADSLHLPTGGRQRRMPATLPSITAACII